MKCTYKNNRFFNSLSKNSGRRYLKLAAVLSFVLLVLISFSEKANAQLQLNSKINRGPFYTPSSLLTCGSTIIPATQSGFVKKFTGSIIKYTYTITNDGDAADIFNLTAAWQNIGVNMGIRILDMSNNPITFTPSLAPLATYFFQLELTVGPNSPDVYNITGITATSTTCPNVVTSTANAVTYQYAGNNPPNPSTSDLEITKTANPSNPTVTDIITYTISVYNNGDKAAAGVIVTDNIPSSVTYVTNSATTASGTISVSGSTLSWTIGTIPIVGTVTASFQVSLSCTSGNSITNTATVSSNPQDANTTNNSSIVVTPITGTGTPASITTQPSNATTCFGNTSFTVAAAGSGLTYQWQVNAGSGFTNISDGGVYSGATTATLTITGATIAMNGYTYQVIVSGTCGPSVTSNPAVTLTVNGALSAGSHNINSVTACVGYNPDILSLNPPTNTLPSGGSPPYTYQWYENGNPVGTNSSSYDPPAILIAGIYVYYVTITDACGTSVSTATKTITIVPDPSANVTGSGTFCQNSSVTLTGSISDGTGTYTYEWYSGPSSTGPWTIISGANSLTYSPPTSSAGTIYYQFVGRANGSGCNDAKSPGVAVIVNPLPTITLGTPASVCFNTAAQTTTLLYSATTFSPTTYSIVWDATALGVGFINVTDAALISSPITINVPAGAPANTTYNGTLTVKNTNGCVSTAYPISITVNPKPGPIIISHN